MDFEKTCGIIYPRLTGFLIPATNCSYLYSKSVHELQNTPFLLFYFHGIYFHGPVKNRTKDTYLR